MEHYQQTVEEIMTSPKRNRRLNQMKQCDFVFLSYPNSGRTWVRYFLSKYFEKKYSVEISIEFVPKWNPKEVPSIDFTHNFFDYFQHYNNDPYILDAKILDKKPIITMTRDPRDAAISFYNDKSHREKIYDGSLNDFLFSDVYGIDRQSKFVLALLDFYKNHTDKKMLLTYENLSVNTKNEFYKLINFIDSPVDEIAFKYALEESKFKNMQDKEKSLVGTVKSMQRLAAPTWDGEEQSLKMRKGKAKNYKSEISEESLNKIVNLPYTKELLERFKKY